LPHPSTADKERNEGVHGIFRGEVDSLKEKDDVIEIYTLVYLSLLS